MFDLPGSLKHWAIGYPCEAIPKQPDQANTKQFLLTASWRTLLTATGRQLVHSSKACIANLGKIPKMPNPHRPNDPPTSHGSLGLWTQAQGASKIISRNGMVARMLTSWSTMDQRWGKSVAMASTSPNAIQSVLCRYVRYQKYSKLKKKMRCTSLHQLHCQPCEMSSNAHWHAVHCEFSTSSNTRFWDSGRCTAKVEPLCNAASSRSNASSEAQAKRKASIAQTC